MAYFNIDVRKWKFIIKAFLFFLQNIILKIVFITWGALGPPPSCYSITIGWVLFYPLRGQKSEQRTDGNSGAENGSLERDRSNKCRQANSKEAGR